MRTPNLMGHNSLIGSAEACRLLEIDRSTLIRWIRDGSINPVTKLPGSNGAWIFDRSDIEQLAALA